MSGAIDPVAADIGVSADELAVWVERRWVLPDRLGVEPVFGEVDWARLRMIVAFRRDLAIDDEAMPVVLDLLDRLHAARARLRDILSAVGELPEPAQAAILDRIVKGGDNE